MPEPGGVPHPVLAALGAGVTAYAGLKVARRVAAHWRPSAARPAPRSVVACAAQYLVAYDAARAKQALAFAKSAPTRGAAPPAEGAAAETRAQALTLLAAAPDFASFQACDLKLTLHRDKVPFQVFWAADRAADACSRQVFLELVLDVCVGKRAYHVAQPGQLAQAIPDALHVPLLRMLCRGRACTGVEGPFAELLRDDTENIFLTKAWSLHARKGPGSAASAASVLLNWWNARAGRYDLFTFTREDSGTWTADREDSLVRKALHGVYEEVQRGVPGDFIINYDHDYFDPVLSSATHQTHCVSFKAYLQLSRPSLLHATARRLQRPGLVPPSDAAGFAGQGARVLE